MPQVEFKANGSTASRISRGARVRQRSGVVVLQEWWGLDDHIRSVCDRLAADGFVALAPDLYHGETTQEPDEAQQKMMALSMDVAETEMSGAVEFLAADDGRRAAAASARSGSVSAADWRSGRRASTRRSRAVVSFYYVMPHGKPDFTRIEAPLLGHFGTADDFIEVEKAEELLGELREAGVEAEFVFYEGAGHAFFNDTNRLGTYDPDAAARAWQRSIDFLHENL